MGLGLLDSRSGEGGKGRNGIKNTKPPMPWSWAFGESKGGPRGKINIERFQNGPQSIPGLPRGCSGAVQGGVGGGTAGGGPPWGGVPPHEAGPRQRRPAQALRPARPQDVELRAAREPPEAAPRPGRRVDPGELRPERRGDPRGGGGGGGGVGTTESESPALSDRKGCWLDRRTSPHTPAPGSRAPGGGQWGRVWSGRGSPSQIKKTTCPPPG